MIKYKDRYKSYCVRFNHEDWEDLVKRYEQLTEHLKIKISKHIFIKSCIAAGVEAIAAEMDDIAQN